MTGHTRTHRVGPVTAVAILVLIAAATGALIGSGAPHGTMAAIGLVCVVVGAAVTVLHPRAIYYTLAFVLGAMPVAVVPGLNTPAVFVLAIATWLALLVHPIAETRTNGVELTAAVLVVASFLSMVMLADGTKHYVEFIKWLIATSVIFALCRLDRSVLRRFGQVFAIGTFAGASFALLIFKFDKSGSVLNYLSPIGYGRTGVVGTHLRFYVLENSTVLRLTGTYVDPNAAGVFLLVGAACAIALFRGWARIVMAPVILGALVFTLSRQSMFSIAVGLVVYLLFQKLTGGQRLAIIGAAIVSAAAILARPAIYSRIFSSFGSGDLGARDRAQALANYTNTMAGHWWFGRGWGAPEFTDEVVGYKVVYVANSPLLTIYRGGILTGLAFVVLLVVAAVIGYRNMRRDPWESGVIGAFFIGFAVVGLQLDFPVVTLAPMTMVFMVLLTLVAVNPVESAEPEANRIADEPDGPGGLTAELRAEGQVRSHV